MTINELNTRAAEYIQAGDVAAAELMANDALTAALLAVDILQEANALHALGDVARLRCEYGTAEKYYRQALAINEALGRKSGIAGNLNNIGLVYDYLSDYPTALEYYRESLAIHTELGNKDGISTIFSNMGLVYHFLADYHTALEYYQKSLAICQELGNNYGIGVRFSNIGLVFDCMADYQTALEYYQKALAICQEIGDKAGIATNYGNIGNVLESLSSYDKALEYHQLALSINQETGSKDVIAINLGGIGNVYQKLEDYPRALEYMQQALAIDEELGLKFDMTTVLGNIGSVYMNLRDYPQALECAQKALEISEMVGDKEGIAFNLGTIGELHGQSDFEGYDPVQAEEYLLKALKICEEIGDKQHLYVFHKSLADVFENENRWQDFAVHYKKFHEIKEEIQTKDATKQSQLMEYRRQVEEAERDRQINLARFQEQEKILHNILPTQIAERMIDGEKTIADSHEHVSVFFSDIVSFTKLSQQVSAQELVGMLNGIFTQFDQLARKHGLEKIKTIGDAYMAVCGVPTPVDNHAERTANFALDVAELMNNYQTNNGDKVMIRIGLHSGSVVAGIIGENKFAYDMWGDAVNTASRMESHGEAGKIHVSEEFKQAILLGAGQNGQSPKSPVSPKSHHFIDRGELDIKGKGTMNTYFLERS